MDNTVADITAKLPHRAGHAYCEMCEAVLVMTAPIAMDREWKECPECNCKAVQFMDLPIPGAESA